MSSQQSKFVVWGQPQCVYCDMAKKLLTMNGLKFEYKEIGNGYSKEDLLSVLPTARGVPQIFIDDIPLGGYKELAKYLLHVAI